MKKKRKRLIFIILIFIILILFITKSYLYIRPLLGNDLIIKLTSDKETIFINSDSEEIEFKIYTATNPFCTTICSYEFKDLSDGILIESSSIKLTSTSPLEKKYTIFKDLKQGKKLLQFNINCKSLKSTLCSTSEEEISRTKLITIVYELTPEEKNIKEISKEKIISFLDRINFYYFYFSQFKNIFEKFEINILDSKTKLNSLNSSIYNLRYLFESQEYTLLNEQLVFVENQFLDFEADFQEKNKSLYENINLYNSKIDNLTLAKEKLEDLQEKNFSLNTTQEIDSLIKEFNNISFKQDSINDLIQKINNLNLEEGDFYSNKIIGNITYKKINLNFEYSSEEIQLQEPFPVCCLSNNCNPCLNDKNNIPIIFLHGHNFNEDVSAERSLNTFSEFQKNLDYINAGSVLISDYNNDFKGILSGFNSPFSFKASYYFDIYTNKEDFILIQTKEDNLDTYSIRLKNIIEDVKFKTGKEKVILITHSMGGLVARRYIQIFGSDSVEKLFLIASPNYGLKNDIVKYCNIFGSKLECNDMSENSLFINKLSKQIFDIPVYNIIGIGCKMGDETGDGIVTRESAYLESAVNYEIKGTCSKFDLLHTKIVKNKEVFYTIKNLL